jgi:RNA-directed DNA polymerase
VSLLTELADSKNLRNAWKALHKEPSSFGVDNITIDEFRNNLDLEIEALSKTITNGSYKPLELMGHPLAKNKPRSRVLDKKEYRILKVPTVRDRVVQKAVELLINDHLDKVYKFSINKVSFAYVKRGGVEKAANQVRDYYRDGFSYVYKADIEKFFDKVDNDLLLRKISKALPDKTLMPLIRQFLEIDIANIKDIEDKTQIDYTYDPMIGIAQGSPLSPLFANVFLANVDKKAQQKKLNMVRYADDIVILTKTKDGAIEAHKFLESELTKIKLTLHPLLIQHNLPIKGHEKHSVVRKYSGLLFLGLRFTGDKIYPSGDSYENAIWTVRRAAYNQKLSFVQRLTSIDARIKGWCSSYSFTDYLDEPIAKNDKLLEDVLTKMLKKAGLKTLNSKSATQALGIEGYKTRITRLQTKRANKAKAPNLKRK